MAQSFGVGVMDMGGMGTVHSRSHVEIPKVHVLGAGPLHLPAAQEDHHRLL